MCELMEQSKDATVICIFGVEDYDWIETFTHGEAAGLRGTEGATLMISLED